MSTEPISPEETLETLKFIIKSVKNNKLDVLDNSFVNKHFTFIKWDTDEEIKKGSNNIKLTHYAIYHYPGSEKQSEKFPYALYGFPSDAFLDSFKLKNKITKLTDIKNQIVNDKFHKATTFRFGKQNILNGILDTPEFKEHIKPLVWVSRNTLERALYEGGIFIDMPNGQTKLFNVDRCNNIFYDRSIVDETGKVIDEDQERYWTFREIKNNNENPRNQRYHKLLSLGLAAFAHDKKELGLGKLIAIRYTNEFTNEKEVLIGILADVGGAFVDNLHQLDLYGGTFQTREIFNKSTEKFPLTVEAYILKKRSGL